MLHVDEKSSKLDEEELRREGAIDAASWMFSFTFTPEGVEPIRAYRRFVAIVYVVRPDLLAGRNMREIAASLAYGKTTFESDVKAVREAIKFEGRLAEPARGKN
jgi:hypothetical protein